MYIYYSYLIYLSEYRKFIAKKYPFEPFLSSIITNVKGRKISERKADNGEEMRKTQCKLQHKEMSMNEWMLWRREKKSNFLFHILLFVVLCSLPSCQASNSFLSLLFFCVIYTTRRMRQTISILHKFNMINIFFHVESFSILFYYSMSYFVILRAGVLRGIRFWLGLSVVLMNFIRNWKFFGQFDYL